MSSQGALAAWLEHAGLQRVSGTGQGARATCPFHDDPHRTFAVYTNGRYRCWSTRCGKSGFIKELEELFGITAPVLVEALALPADEMPEIPRARLAPYRYAYEEAAKRGIPKSEVEAWDLRWDHRPEKKAILIPVHDDRGRIVSCIWRFSDSRRYRNHPGLPRASLLYGLWRVTGDEVYLCEGPGDAWKLWSLGYQAVASLGAHLTEGQVAALARRGIGSVVIWYDNDKAGFEGAMLAADRLHGLVDVSFAMGYAGSWPKDPGECDAITAARLSRQRLGIRELRKRYYRKFDDGPASPLTWGK